MNKQTKRGFTLLEVLISTGIFMIVMVVAVGVFTISVSGSSVAEQLRVNSQAARFAFESLSREIRLSGHLVNIDEGVEKMIIPPFEVLPPDPLRNIVSDQILVYQIQKKGIDKDGQQKYSIIRKTYALHKNEDETTSLTVLTQKAYEDPKTLVDIVKDINGPAQIVQTRTERISWTPEADSTAASSATAVILPTGLTADQFKVVHWAPYPGFPNTVVTAEDNSDTAVKNLKVQPFIQLNLTVANYQFNRNRDENKRVRTTLRTTIVPRSFINPFDAGQSGVQGASQ